MSELTQAAADVLAERKRQIEEERWTPEHDDEHADGELAIAAAHYAAFDTGANVYDDLEIQEWLKPGSHRENLVKAGALILAEIERLDRGGA